MPWPQNPAGAKQRARDRTNTSRADYANQQNQRDADAAQGPASGTTAGFNADRGAWNVRVQGGSKYVPAQTNGAVKNGAVNSGGIVWREALPQTEPAQLRKAFLDSGAFAGFGVLYIIGNINSNNSGSEDDILTEQNYTALWSDTGAINKFYTGADTWLPLPSFGSQRPTCKAFALNETRALILLTVQVPSDIVPPEGAYRLSIFLLNKNTGLEWRENYQWELGENGDPWNWPVDSPYLKFRPTHKEIFNVRNAGYGVQLSTAIEQEYEIQCGYPLEGFQDNNLAFTEGAYTFGSGGYNEAEEYLELPRFVSDYSAFSTLPGYGTGGFFYPELYNYFADDSRQVLKAINATTSEVAGTIAAYAPARGIGSLTTAAGEPLSNYYFMTNSSAILGNTVAQIPDFIGDSTLLIDEYQYWMVDGGDEGIIATLATKGLTGGDDLPFLQRLKSSKVIEWIAQKPYRTTAAEPTP